MKNVKAFILDLDHCLYQDPSDKNERYEQGAVKAAVRLGLCKDFAEATRIVRQSVLDHKSEIEEFARRPGTLRNPIFTAYHEEALPFFIETVKAVPGLADQLARAKDAGIDIAVLTHSAREWAVPMLQHLGLSEIIPENRVWALNDKPIDFRLKSKSSEPFALVCDALGVTPDQALMADDVDKNLYYPHQLKAVTVQIAWNDVVMNSAKPAHVDYKALNLPTFLSRYNFS